MLETFPNWSKKTSNVSVPCTTESTVNPQTSIVVNETLTWV